MAADLLLDQGSRGFPRAEAGDADARRQLSVSLLDRLVVAFGLDFDLQTDLTFG
jgi:hypothetical protein